LIKKMHALRWARFFFFFFFRSRRAGAFFVCGAPTKDEKRPHTQLRLGFNVAPLIGTRAIAELAPWPRPAAARPRPACPRRPARAGAQAQYGATLRRRHWAQQDKPEEFNAVVDGFQRRGDAGGQRAAAASL
jgi:hypothetical protein